MSGARTVDVTDPSVSESSIHSAIERGIQWLLDRVESGEWMKPSPIGFYFAKLWYYEKLYPMIFTVGALNRVASLDHSTVTR